MHQCLDGLQCLDRAPPLLGLKTAHLSQAYSDPAVLAPVTVVALGPSSLVSLAP